MTDVIPTAAALSSNGRMMQPVELEIELFCRGVRIDATCHTDEDGRRISRTRAGLGSGLELIIPGKPKPLWVNAPVVEAFAQASVFVLRKIGARYSVLDTRTGEDYPVAIPPEPAWYSRRASSGVPMSRIGVLQGNYLGIYISSACAYWNLSNACKFCTTGKNVGTSEEW